MIHYKEDDRYEKVDGHLGCTVNGVNLGLIGRPKDILSDVSTECKDGVAACFDLAKRACDAITDCWGFAIHKSWGVQIYNSKAANKNLCNGKYGLQDGKSSWTTFKKFPGIMLHKKCIYSYIKIK